MSNNLKAELDQIIAEGVASGPLPCAAFTVFDTATVHYDGAAGPANDRGVAMSSDSVVWVASLTKALTATAAMILVEQGRLDLDAPARDHAPWLDEVEVLAGFDADGAPQLRAPQTSLTTRQLLTHTAGFGYPYWNADLKRFVEDAGLPSIGSRRKAAIRLPLGFEPGTAWHYGIGIDWVGLIIEAITGETLGQWMQARLFDPLGMHDTGFALGAEQRERLVPMCRRDASGGLSLAPTPGSDGQPEFELGGGGLFSTVRDYVRFCRLILNGGELDGVRVLKPETVAELCRDQIPDLSVGLLHSTDPAISGDAEFFPGIDKGWSLGFMVNRGTAPTGRPAGSLAWAGLANSYYWIDRQNGIGGVFTSQLQPFVDPAALALCLRLETTVYDHLRAEGNLAT